MNLTCRFGWQWRYTIMTYGQGPGYGVHLNAIENLEGELEVYWLERKLHEI